MKAPRVIAAKEACRILGISCAEFWKLVHRYKVPRFVYGPRMIRFSEAVILELRAFFLAITPADMKRIADGRHTFSWSDAHGR